MQHMSDRARCEVGPSPATSLPGRLVERKFSKKEPMVQRVVTTGPIRFLGMSARPRSRRNRFSDTSSGGNGAGVVKGEKRVVKLIRCIPVVPRK